MKKKQLLALALVGAMTAGTAASMAPVHAEMKEAPASKEEKRKVAKNVKKLYDESVANDGKIIGTARIKNALKFLTEEHRNENNYELLKEINSLFTTKLGEFVNFKDDADHDHVRTDKKTTPLADQSIRDFIKEETALKEIDENNLVKRYMEDGVEYDNVAQYLKAANKNVEILKKAVKDAETELATAIATLEKIPAYTAGEDLKLTEQRREAEMSKTTAENNVVTAKQALVNKEINVIDEINLVELRHRVQKAVTSLVEKMAAKVDEAEKKAALDTAVASLTMATKVESLGIGETAYLAKRAEVIEKDANTRAAFLAKVNEQLKVGDPIMLTADDVEGFLNGNMSHVQAIPNETQKQTTQRKLDLMQTVVDTTEFDKAKMQELYFLANAADLTTSYAQAKQNVAAAKTAVDKAEKAYNTAVEVAQKAVKLYERELENIKLANFAQNAKNLAYIRNYKGLDLKSVTDKNLLLLTAKQAADKAVADQEKLIAETETTTAAGKAKVEGYKATLETLKETAATATEKYDDHMKAVEKLSKEYTEFYNKVVAEQEKLLAGTNYQDMIDVTRILSGFKEAHNELANKLEMPTFDLNQNKPMANEPISWVKVDGKWYYRSAKGTNKYVSEWALIDNVWYRFDANGAMLSNQWFKDTNNRWYWLNASGRMSSMEWVLVNGSWFFAYGDGMIAENEWVLYNGTWYYAENGGYIAMNKTVMVNGVNYSFDATGALK